MAQKSKNDPRAVDAYLATLPKAERETLTRLRTLIKKAAPQIEERISYGTIVMFSLRRDRQPAPGSHDEGGIDEDPQCQRGYDSFFTRESVARRDRPEDLRARIRENAALGRRAR